MAVVGEGCCAGVFGVCPGTPVAGIRVGRRWRCGLANPSGAATGGGERTGGPGCRVRWGRRLPSGGCGGLGSGGAGGGPVREGGAVAGGGGAGASGEGAAAGAQVVRVAEGGGDQAVAAAEVE